MPASREIRVYTADELERIAAERDQVAAAAVTFAAATGPRPAEWASVARRDVDRTRRILYVWGTKTARSRREVPLTRAALGTLDAVPPRLDSRYVYTTSRKCPGKGEPGPFDIANFRRREWGPAIDAAGITKPARLYDLRSTFASNALAAGITTFELARIMGTSVKMIEQHYGTLIDTAHGAILSRLEHVAG
jgi:integrase